MNSLNEIKWTLNFDSSKIKKIYINTPVIGSNLLHYKYFSVSCSKYFFFYNNALILL